MNFNEIVFKIKELLKEKSGASKLKILRSPIFIGVLFLKFLSSILFASDYLVKLFVPFVNYYVLSGFSNPYTYFFQHGVLNIFPYPQVMLWFLTLPRFVLGFFLTGDYSQVSNYHLLLSRLPIIFADIVIFIILARWLKHKQEKVLWYYWCSPILFYINYIHGQLDAIPMMLLFVSLYWLFKEKFYLALGLFGLAVATKTGMLVAAPFILVFLLLKGVKLRKILVLVAMVPAVFLLTNFNQLAIPGFLQLVFKNQEQIKVFVLNYSLGNNLVLYFVPMAYLILLVRSLAFKSFNRSLFLMFLGFGFGILTLLIPPMPGWYYWIMPFFIYFYVKEDKPLNFSFVLLNILYFAYFIINKNSDFPQFFQPISTYLSNQPNLYSVLASNGYDANLLVSIVFSLLQATLLINVVWIYRQGVSGYMQHKIKYQPYLIGISGDSGSGKSSLSQWLTEIFGGNNLLVVRGDDLHRWERGDESWQKFTHLNPLANRLHLGLEQIANLKLGNNIDRQEYNHDTGRFGTKELVASKRVVIFEGLHALYLNEMRKACDLKIFLQPDERLRYYWKVIRDAKERGYTKEAVLEQLKSRETDSQEYINKQEQFSDITISFFADDSSLDWDKLSSDPGLSLKIKFNHEINVDVLVDALNSINSVKVKHYYDDQNQFLELNGSISASDISMLAHNLVPDLDEVITAPPIWRSNYEGLIQLFINYYIFGKVRLYA